MAIYQFYIATIPKKGIIEFFGKVPKKLKVDFKKRTENFLNDDIEDEFDYFEFVQNKCWNLAKINSQEIISQLDQILERADWGNDKESNNWKTQNEDIDNDAWILTNADQNQILEFTFRVDLRQSELKFLIEMIELSKENELLFIDNKGILVEPKIENVMQLIKNSNALKFIENPNKFLKDLGEGIIEIE